MRLYYDIANGKISLEDNYHRFTDNTKDGENWKFYSLYELESFIKAVKNSDIIVTYEGKKMRDLEFRSYTSITPWLQSHVASFGTPEYRVIMMVDKAVSKFMRRLTSKLYGIGRSEYVGVETRSLVSSPANFVNASIDREAYEEAVHYRNGEGLYYDDGKWFEV